MINFLPQIYEQELLISLLKRYHRDSSHYAFLTTFENFFGPGINYSHSYLPTNLNKFIANMPSDFNITVNDIIENHTLYHYYTCFLPQEKKEAIKNNMKIKEDLLNRVMKSQTIPLNRFFRYCPTCLKEQLKETGDFSWNRIHQISFICTRHHEILQDSGHKLNNKNLDYYIPVPYSSEKVDFFDKLFNISKRIEHLVIYSSTVNKQQLKTVYMIMFDQLDFLYRSRGQIHLQKLMDAIEEYFTKELLAYLQVKSDCRWVEDMLTESNYSTHPLYHILMQEFLCITDKDIIEMLGRVTKIKQQLFKMGFHVDDVEDHLLQYYKKIADLNITCKNPLAAHKKVKKITDLTIEYNYAKQELDCVLKCECGFIYRSSYEELIEGAGEKVGYILNWGHVYYEELAKIRCLGAAKISRMTGLKQSTIKNHFRRINI